MIRKNDDTTFIEEGQCITQPAPTAIFFPCPGPVVQAVHCSLDIRIAHPYQGIEQIMPAVSARTHLAGGVNTVFITIIGKLIAGDKTDGWSAE